MLEAPLTASSIGTATFAATTCALAPTYVVVTVTVGGVIYGYCSRGSDRYDKAPMRTINSDIAIAKFGRWMKKWLSMAYGFAYPLWTVVAGLSAPEGSGGGARSTGVTLLPGRAFCKPSTITRSPALRPSR